MAFPTEFHRQRRVECHHPGRWHHGRPHRAARRLGGADRAPGGGAQHRWHAGIPAATQTAGTVWEIELYQFTITTAGVITLTDVRRFCQYPTVLVTQRFGGTVDTNWATPGTLSARPSRARQKLGSANWTGSAAATGTLTVSVGFAYAGSFLVFVNSTNKLVNVAATPDGGNASFTIAWNTVDGSTITSLDVFWQTWGSLT